jgi:hypothetical protein
MQRDLEIGGYEELVQEIKRLHAEGYDKLGNWNLAQISNHCNFFMQMYVHDYSNDFKKSPGY